MFIEGFGIAGYRSFGAELQKISPCAKVNLLVGQNNSGKSNVLLFLKSHFKSAVGATQGGSDLRFSELDKHIASQTVPFAFALAMPFDGEVFKRTEDNLPGQRGIDADAILRTPSFTQVKHSYHTAR